MKKKTFSYDEAFTKCVEYFKGDELAANVFLSKYALTDNDGNLIEQTPDDMHKRLAKEFARVEKKYPNSISEEEIYSLFKDFKYVVPQGSPMSAIGNEHQIQSSSNCYVLPSVSDSYSSILRTDEYLVQISKRRGGNGVDVSHIRPKGLVVNNAAKTTTGIGVFMERFSNSIREVGQCIAKGQRILTKRGLIKIEEVVPGDLVWTKSGWVKNLNVLSNGIKTVYKVKSVSGFEIKTTEDHVFQTFDENGNLTQTKLKDLTTGSSVVLCVGTSDQEKNYVKLINDDYKNVNNKPLNCIYPEILDEKLAYILGYSYGDGSVEEEAVLDLACSDDYPEIKQKISTFTKDIFDYKINFRKGDGKLERLSINNKAIVQFLKLNNILKQKSGNLVFPENIINSPVSVQMSFLSGYFDADGYASGKKRGYCFSSVDIDFIKECQKILMSVGVVSKIHSEDRSKNNWKPLYTLCVVGKNSQISLLENFQQSIKANISNHISKRECWLTPFKASTSKIKYNDYSYCPDNSQFLSLDVVKRLLLEGEDICNNLIQDKIAEITLEENVETYDLQLESEHLFWCEGFYVHNSGRRGALMMSIDVHHPEVETFINIKKDKTKVTGANISVKLTDDFMTAVKEDKEYEQYWPMTGKKKISKFVKARDIWNQIIHCAWESAEPGILFWDNAIKNTPSDAYKSKGFGSVSTNPCQPAWAKFLTKDGIRELKDVHIGDEIWSKEGWTKVLNKWSTGVKKVYQYRTTSNVFYGTENHRVVSKGEKIEVKDAEFLDVLRGISENSFAVSPQDVMDGLVIGDGSVHKASNNLVFLNIGRNDHDYFKSEIGDLIVKHRPGIKDTSYEVVTTIEHSELPKTYERKVPERFIKDKNKLVGFLRGLYSANGSICGNRVTLKASSFDIIKDVQLMLNSIGIRSYYTTNKPKSIKFKNGVYLCKQSYDLQITTDRMRFKNIIGFIQDYKNQKIRELKRSDKGETMSYEIKDVVPVSEEEVFDITVDNQSHTYWTEGCDVSNCGEIILSPFDSCRLMAINLSNFVENKFQSNAVFDYKKFSEISEKSQKLMDDLIDLELEQIDKILNKIESDAESDDLKSTEKNMWLKIRKACAEGRRTGLGITALGDTLASLNIVYGSDESIEITEKIYKTLAQSAYKSSIVMAQERGSFPVFEYDLEKNHPFISKIVDSLDDETKKLYKKYGRRNIALTTTAPTGSVSVLTKTTSGIEPAYLLKYTRRKKINPNDKETRVDFTDQMGDKWQEFPVYHHGFKEWMDITGKTEIEESPYFGATSNDVNWNASVKLQAVAQKWICHSISKTCNLPNSATEETVAAVYMEAYDSGCKGFTVYRDGCRTGVLVASDSKEKVNDEIGETNAPKRPNELPCDIHQTVVKGEAWTIFVGKHHDRPYEIFGGLSKFVDLPKKSKEGFIVKDRKKQNKHLYNLVCGEEVIEDIVNTFENPTEGEFTRILSLSLRHGVPIQYITEQLQKDDKNSDMYSFGRVISRVLKTYIKEGTKSSDKNCSNCGAEGTVIYKEGCKTCSNCGNSKCG